uniref:Uncharacterized protein n=1 Tax=Oryza brachyantha TaxID=4533 RepID=J3M4F1_ORYBR
MRKSPRHVVCATLRGQKKKRRGKQRRVLSARSSECLTVEFTELKTLAHIKEERCISISRFNHSTAHTPNVRSFSYDFEGPKSLSELLKTKNRTSVGK